MHLIYELFDPWQPMYSYFDFRMNSRLRVLASLAYCLGSALALCATDFNPWAWSHECNIKLLAVQLYPKFHYSHKRHHFMRSTLHNNYSYFTGEGTTKKERKQYLALYRTGLKAKHTETSWIMYLQFIWTKKVISRNWTSRILKYSRFAIVTVK